MSLTYKFDEKKEKNSQNADSETVSADQKNIELFDTSANARNVCFIEASGKRTFLNYAYLVSGEYSPEESCIDLVFTTHTVKLKGSSLKELYEDFITHQPKRLSAIGERYAVILKEGEASLTEIKVIPNQR